MIEIALCLAIIGFALVSIMLVLPGGMNTQRQTREETIVNQDASMLLEAVRNSARGLDDLTNNVYAITNYWWQYNLDSKPVSHTYGYTRTSTSFDGVPGNAQIITNGLRIIGLLSTPEYTDGFGGLPIADTFGRSYTSNHIVAGLVRSAAWPPRNRRRTIRSCRKTPSAIASPASMRRWRRTPITWTRIRLYSPPTTINWRGNLRELRLLFMWPQLPNGSVGRFRQTFRASVGGQLIQTNDPFAANPAMPLYFYQSQSFTNAP